MMPDLLFYTDFQGGFPTYLFMLSIRPMTRQDLPAVLAIESEVQPNPWSEQAFVDELESRVSGARVALWDGTLAGFLLTRELLGEMEILNLAVAGHSQRKGIARALLESRIAQSAGGSLESIFLEVRIGNQPARRLYCSLGFEAAGLRKRYYADAEDALVMIKKMR